MKDMLERAALKQLVGEAEQRIAAHEIDLVQRQDRAPSALAPPDPPPLAGEGRVGASRSRMCSYRDRHRDDPPGRHRPAAPSGRRLPRRPRRPPPSPVEPAPRLEDARRVDEDQLRRAGDSDAEQPGPRRLYLGGDDRSLRPTSWFNSVDFAGVRRADQRDIAAAGISRSGPPTPLCGGGKGGGKCGRGFICAFRDLAIGSGFRLLLAQKRLQKGRGGGGFGGAFRGTGGGLPRRPRRPGPAR